MSLEDQCWAAFRDGKHHEAVSLLPLMKEPNKIKRTYDRRWKNTSLLHLSSRHGWLDVTKDLVTKYHCDPHECDDGAQNCLVWAAEGNHVDTIRYLIDKCHCNPMAINAYGYTVLHRAANRGSLDVMKYLISHHYCDPKATSNSGETVLHCAARHIDIVNYLIDECHCDPVATNNSGGTVLHCAADHIDIVKYLIDKCHCNPMAIDAHGYTVLHRAANRGSLDVMKYLISHHHCDPMATTNGGQTVLHCAARHIDIVKYLIDECHCDPMATNNAGEIVLHCAADHIDIVKYLINECHCNPMHAIDAYGYTVLHKTGSLDVMRYLIGHHHCDPEAITHRGYTVLHCAARHIDIVKYLIDECHCDPMATDFNKMTTLHKAANSNSSDVVKYLINEKHCDPMTVDNQGQTPLHFAAYWSNPAVVEYLLSTGKCDPLAKDYKGRTPLQLAKSNWRSKMFRPTFMNLPDSTLPIFNKFGDIKSSHPIDSYVNVLLVGNPGAGKSTLSHVINDTATGSFILGSFRNAGDVKPCTAGIIPYKLQHMTLGNIVLHDFAGHSEYYSSHSAVIQNLLQGSGGVFLIVVNILEKEVVKQLHQWLTVVRNEAHKALNQCHVIVIASHMDEVSNLVEWRKEEIQEIIVREKCDSVFLDCRKLGGSGLDSLFKMLSSACKSIRSTSGRNLSLYCRMMYGLLEERKENILTLSDAMSAGKDNNDYILPACDDIWNVLQSLHSTGLISALKSEDKIWVVVNKGILLTEVDGILFAPKTFKEHVDIASNTGIVSVSGLTRLFPEYDPDMLICFLKNMELCQELNPFFLRITNLIAGDREEEREDNASETQRREERLLFFPCLLCSIRPKEMASQIYQFGWCLHCTREHDFFLPRYFHVLSLHLVYKLAQPQEDDKLKRRCTFWKNGLYWSNGHGVGSLVEIVDESQCVLVMMSFEEGYSDNIVSLRRDVIGETMSVYKESCPSLEVKEFVIDPKDLAYPVNRPRERTVYSVKDILSAIDKREEFLVNATGTIRTELKRILADESLSGISNLSLLGGRDVKELIETSKESNTETTMELEPTIEKVISLSDYSATQISGSNDDQQKVILTIRDLVEILRVLNNSNFQTIKWFDLGLYLGLIHNDLKIIEDNYPRDAERCLRECLALWITVDTEATWDKLAIAAGEVRCRRDISC